MSQKETYEVLNYNPGHVANYMLHRARDEDILISLLKLQKLVYIGYGWTLAELNKRLFRERIEAWDHGPVIPSLYHEFRKYGFAPIREFSWKFTPAQGDPQMPQIDVDDTNTRKVLDIVWSIYKHFSAPVLRDKTHEEGTPWHKAYQPGKNIPLDDDIVRDHFQGKISLYLKEVS